MDDRFTGQSDQLNFHEGRGSMPDAASLQETDRLVPYALSFYYFYLDQYWHMVICTTRLPCGN